MTNEEIKAALAQLEADKQYIEAEAAGCQGLIAQIQDWMKRGQQQSDALKLAGDRFADILSEINALRSKLLDDMEAGDDGEAWKR